MDKELINTLSDLLDEKLKPINNRLDKLEESQNNILKKLDTIENKLDLTYEQVALNSEDIVSIKENLGDIEYTTAKNSLDLIKLKNIKNKRG